MKSRASSSRSQVRGRGRATTVRSRASRPAAKRSTSARSGSARSKSARSRSTGARTSASARGGASRARSGGRGGSAKLTTDHEEIRRWVEERGGHPATVKRSVKPGQPAGILRIDFPGFSGAGSLKAVSWDEWFEIFDENRLGFLRQNRTASGKTSRFNKIVCRT